MISLISRYNRTLAWNYLERLKKKRVLDVVHYGKPNMYGFSDYCYSPTLVNDYVKDIFDALNYRIPLELEITPKINAITGFKPAESEKISIKFELQDIRKILYESKDCASIFTSMSYTYETLLPYGDLNNLWDEKYMLKFIAAAKKYEEIFTHLAKLEDIDKGKKNDRMFTVSFYTVGTLGVNARYGPDSFITFNVNDPVDRSRAIFSILGFLQADQGNLIAVQGEGCHSSQFLFQATFNRFLSEPIFHDGYKPSNRLGGRNPELLYQNDPKFKKLIADYNKIYADGVLPFFIVTCMNKNRDIDFDAYFRYLATKLRRDDTYGPIIESLLDKDERIGIYDLRTSMRQKAKEKTFKFAEIVYLSLD